MRFQFVFLFCAILSASSSLNAVEPVEKPGEPKHLTFRAVPFTDVQIARSKYIKDDAAIWGERLETNRTVSIPHNFDWCEKTGRFNNFAKAAGLLQGNFEGIYFNDSDVYKVLEGTAYSLRVHPDPELEKRADAVIDLIAAAQLPDGYINTYYQLKEPDKKWTNTRVMHELYCGGHMVEAAVAYAQATGKTKLLDVAEKFMDHIMTIFGPEEGKRVEVPGHEEIELALVKLYQYTGKEKYLDLAKFFIDVRGDQSKRTDKLQGPYSQDHVPVRDQKEIVGHAVRAVYLYAGVADVAAYTGDEGLIKAMDALWGDVVHKKMYITGGIGARHEGEAFGDAFELPNRTAYCETCAAIGLVFWAHRMNLLHGDAKYADVVERALFNGVLSGIGMDGKHFFYVNPLESTGNHHRQPFFDCACCPTNVVRFLPSLPGYQYATSGNTIYVNQFVSGKATVRLPDGDVTITQKTNFPWDGKVEFEFDRKPNPQVKGTFDVKIRQPQWLGTRKGDYSVILHIDWNKPADLEESISHNFPMQLHRIVAHPKVVADQGRVAIQRGPVVYCFEQVDNEVPVLRINLARDPEFKEEFREDLLGGIVVLKCKNADGRELTAIPYYAWDHREPGPMAVWVRQQGLSKNPDVEDSAWNDENGNPILYRELSDKMLSAENPAVEEIEPYIAASYYNNRDSLDAVFDVGDPKDSNDHSITRMTFWDHKGTMEWIEMDFGNLRKVSKTSVYWFDDTGRGQCRIPKSATLSYKTKDGWKKFDVAIGIEKDKYNVVEFPETETTGLRLDVQLQDGVSGGILRWRVGE